MKTTALLMAAAGALAAGAAAAQHEHHTAGAPSAPGGAPAAAPAAEAARRPDAAREWTRLPLLAPGMAPAGERRAAVLRPTNIDAKHVQVFAAEGPAERRQVGYPVGAEGARIESATPKIGNYHWVVAREEAEGLVRVASTVWYFSNPGDSPAALLKERRHELEIIPEPLPREHGNYRESEKWRFLVRHEGVPLAGQKLTLETEFGSRSSFLTDATGYATVLFPRDFRPAKDGRDAGGHGPRRAKFVLATEKEGLGRRYVTAFNYTYGQDADRNRSLGWGAFFGVVGMAAAAPLLRRRTQKPQEETPNA